jgi:GNAT superfamily N-acetyltransferase
MRKRQGHLFLKRRDPAAYAAIVFDKDPYYEKIDGKWLSDGEPYVAVHRLAVADEFLGLDMARHILQYAEKRARIRNVRWFRIDTHHDNIPMRNLIRDFGFTFCGMVQVRDGKRMAYEKRVADNA